MVRKVILTLYNLGLKRRSDRVVCTKLSCTRLISCSVTVPTYWHRKTTLTAVYEHLHGVSNIAHYSFRHRFLQLS